mgnify:CR=1 FL=1
MKNWIALVIFTMLASGSAFAAAAKGVAPVAKGAVDVGDPGDGCGLGWQVTDKRTLIASTTRGTINGFVPPTFGLTSGTIGCMKYDFAKNEEAAATFAYANSDSLRTDMAEGHGEYLAGMARSFGCSDAVTSRFGEVTQKNYSEITQDGAASPIQMFRNLQQQIRADEVLSVSCDVV